MPYEHDLFVSYMHDGKMESLPRSTSSLFDDICRQCFQQTRFGTF